MSIGATSALCPHDTFRDDRLLPSQRLVSLSTCRPSASISVSTDASELSETLSQVTPRCSQVGVQLGQCRCFSWAMRAYPFSFPFSHVLVEKRAKAPYAAF